MNIFHNNRSESKERVDLSKNDFYQLIIDRILEHVSYDSEEMDRISNALSSTQGRRVYNTQNVHRDLMEMSFFDHLNRWNPDVSPIISQAHDEAVSTLQKIHGANKMFEKLKEKGTQSEGQQLSIMLNQTIKKKLYK